MSRVETSIHIDAPPEKVWDVVMDPNRLGDWVTIHRKLGAVSDRPLHEGSTMEQTLCIAHANFKVRWTVTEMRDRSVTWDGRGPARSKAHTHYHAEPDGNGGTRFDYVNDFTAPGGPLGKVADRMLVGGISKREAERSLHRLKELVER
jgi:carbon monoxide dehydrogenase subunit G